MHEVIIIGAGFGGMGAAIELKRIGFEDVLILEREPELGGTWQVNRYPGLAVDIAAVTYSYSFEPNPNWSRLYAPGAEIKQYAVGVADKYDLVRHMRFGVEVLGARWDEAEKFWTVETAGEVFQTRYLITATGYLSQPKLPDIDGIDSFAGTVVHSADWDDSVGFAGKSTAIIGTGATGVQLVPELAARAERLTVYQRTPIWVVPKFDFAIPRLVQRIFGAVPATQRLARLFNSTILEVLSVGGVLNYQTFKAGNGIATLLSRAHLFVQLRDRKLRKELTPKYSFGCKRPTFSNTYFRAFARPNVTLETTPIRAIEPDGIVTTDGHKNEIDVLVLATGFSLWEKNFPAIDVVGRDGINLGQWWRDSRFQAYEGLSIPQFPNFFCLHSPYSYTGLSYFWTIEAQMVHLRRVFEAAAQRGAATFEVRAEANARFLEETTRRLGRSVFYRGNCSGARSYYFDPHGEASLLSPNSVLQGNHAARDFPIDDYNFG